MNDAKNEGAGGASASNAGLGWQTAYMAEFLRTTGRPCFVEPAYNWPGRFRIRSKGTTGAAYTKNEILQLTETLKGRPAKVPNAEITGRTLAQNEADGA